MDEKEIKKLAKKHKVSPEAVRVLHDALRRGNLTMAQFNHPELGGSGQWMQGGMVMVGDMFNNGLKAKVDALCVALAAMLTNRPTEADSVTGQSQQQSSHGTGTVAGQDDKSKGTKGKGKQKPGIATGPTMAFRPMESADWWPAEFGAPNSSGAQNNMRYAYFGAAKRLVIEINGRITVYDTGDHRISGVSQQQSGTQSLTFTSQHGTVPLSRLKVVSSK